MVCMIYEEVNRMSEWVCEWVRDLFGVMVVGVVIVRSLVLIGL